MVQAIHRARAKARSDLAIPICGGQTVYFDHTSWRRRIPYKCRGSACDIIPISNSKKFNSCFQHLVLRCLNIVFSFPPSFVFCFALSNILMRRFLFLFTFRGLHWKMQQDQQLRETWIFILFMLRLFLHHIQVSHLKECWKCRRSGNLVLYLRAQFKFLLESSRLLITLRREWQ